MMSSIKYSVCFAIFGIGAFSIAMANSDHERLKYFADKIVAQMPSTWRMVEEKTGVIPYGHYDGLTYDGPGGLALVLEGDQDVFLHWKDKSGDWHKEPLAKESLELWIMPPEYHLSWKRFLIMKSPFPAERVYSGKKVKVYGYPTSRTSSPENFDQIMSTLPAVTTSWPDSPHHTGILSWTTWKEDIEKVLQDAEE